MNELLARAREALLRQDGRTALTLADQALEQDETCSEAWLIAMQSFQLFLPIDAYEPENELRCARYAIRFAPKAQKAAVRRQVYPFLLGKVLEVLRRDAQVLSDGRELVSFYQKTAYFDASGAAEKARLHDQPVIQAVQRSFAYCEALFAAVPPSAIRRSRRLNDMAAQIADQWQKTYSFYAMRMGMVRCEMTPEGIRDGLRQYALYLRAVRGAEEIIRRPVPFNTIGEDQPAYLL